MVAVLFRSVEIVALVKAPFDVAGPAVADINLNLLNPLTLRTDTVEVTVNPYFEQNQRIDCRTTVVGALEVFDLNADEVDIFHASNFTQQMIRRN